MSCPTPSLTRHHHVNTPESAALQWKTALRLLRGIAVLPETASGRDGRIGEARFFFSQCGVPRLETLARLLVPGMSARQLLCVLVPVERVASRQRITDADMGLKTGDGVTAGDHAPMPVIVVADNLRSAVNIGGIFRTAEFFQSEAVWLCGYTATPDHPHVVRSAMGTEACVPWQTWDHMQSAIAALRARGFVIYALETCSKAEPADRCLYRFPAAILLGNERFGLDPDILAGADSVISIAACGTKNSLNVVSAFAIAAQAMRRCFDAC